MNNNYKTFERKIKLLKELPKSAKEAKKVASNIYYTGNLCPKGHKSARYTANNTCVTCTKDNAGTARYKKDFLVGNTNSSNNRKRLSELLDTGEYKEVWEE